MKKKPSSFPLRFPGEEFKSFLEEWAQEEQARLHTPVSLNTLIIRILSQAIDHKKSGKADEKEKNQSKKNNELKPIDLFSNKFERTNGNGKRMGVMTDSVAVM